MMNQWNVSCRVEHLSLTSKFRALVDVLRLDLLHPVVSGNKWFKLKEHLREAKDQEKTLLTFGGAFSNHIAAAAAAAQEAGLKSIGIIRGEEAPALSSTLINAKRYGMQLYFISREAYKQKKIPDAVYESYDTKSLYAIPEGGYGANGAKGAKDILLKNDTSSYTHIFSAVGTGTTLAGLTDAANENQKIIGISVMKNNASLQDDISRLLPPSKHTQFQLLHEYHFGGYARYNAELLRFMNDFYSKTKIPTDFVYTAKAFYAAFELERRGFFSPDDKILLVHTGGLQGNLSLPKGTLMFMP